MSAASGTETVSSAASAPARMAYIYPVQPNWAQIQFSHEVHINHVTLVGLRDTGSNMTSVSRHLVLPEQVIPQKKYMASSYDSKPLPKDVAKVYAGYREFVGDLYILVHDESKLIALFRS